MSEQSSGPTGPQEPPPEPPLGYPPPGQPGPYAGQGPYAAGPTHPMPQWQPVTPRRPFRERTTKLWLAVVLALVGLVVGLGVGIPIGHATGDDDRGPGRFERFPGGPGRHGFGQRDGGGPFGFRNRQQAPGRGQQQPTTPTPPTPTPPTPTPSS